jgi:hypothetical protein
MGRQQRLRRMALAVLVALVGLPFVAVQIYRCACALTGSSIRATLPWFAPG